MLELLDPELLPRLESLEFPLELLDPTLLPWLELLELPLFELLELLLLELLELSLSRELWDEGPLDDESLREFPDFWTPFALASWPDDTKKMTANATMRGKTKVRNDPLSLHIRNSPFRS